jgi:hypothetical protein
MPIGALPRLRVIWNDRCPRRISVATHRRALVLALKRWRSTMDIIAALYRGPEILFWC